jgi:hypothetical protein
LQSLDNIRNQLVQKLGDPSRLGFVNARLILRTGVNLASPKPGYTEADVQKVVKALAEMGFPVE